MVNLPFVESTIGLHVEALFWGWGFSKCIGYISPEKEHVLGGRDSKK
jgi:hypothetical protein